MRLFVLKSLFKEIYMFIESNENKYCNLKLIPVILGMIVICLCRDKR